jgi:hypothetical protein
MANQTASTKGRQIPTVCPGHTRPLAELQFCHVKEENRTLLVSACHGTWRTLGNGGLCQHNTYMGRIHSPFVLNF